MIHRSGIARGPRSEKLGGRGCSLIDVPYHPLPLLVTRSPFSVCPSKSCAREYVMRWAMGTDWTRPE